MLILIVSILICILELFYPLKIYANFTQFVKSINNPLITTGNSGDWDENALRGPSIIWSETNGELWYSASNILGKRQIGFANITSDLNNNVVLLNKSSNNPIILYSFYNTSDIGLELPSIRIINSDRQIWFNNIFGVPNYNFDLFYSFKEGGASWTKPIKLTIPLENFPNVSSLVSPFVQFNNILNKYQMWFGARIGTTGLWNIGYAESSDGALWTNIIIPVLNPEANWEGFSINSPSVLIKDGIYYMFYDGDQKIFYANSLNGIYWVKNKSFSILNPGSISNDFDNSRLMDPYIHEYNSRYYLFYTGINFNLGSYNKSKIGVAFSDNLPPSVITISPTPTPSLSPTPSTTPTPSLTPTPVLFSPIVIVPGMFASLNRDDILSCDIKNSNKWTIPRFEHHYDILLKTLTQNKRLRLNRDVYMYPYDWRQPLDVQGQKLKEFIDEIAGTHLIGTNFMFIGHSMGGLTIRSYMSNNPTTHKAAEVVTVGTPHDGIVLAYPSWEKGEIWKDNLFHNLLLKSLLSICKFRSNNLSQEVEFSQLGNQNSLRETLQANVPSVQSLLPIFNFIRRNGVLVDTNSLHYQNDWLLSHPFPPPYQPILETLSGKDEATLRFLDVAPASKKDQQNGDWIDGKPFNRQTINDGDGTVLSESSSYDGAINEYISGDHGEIIKSKKAIEQILLFLGFTDVSVVAIPTIEETSMLTLTADGAGLLTLTDPKKTKFSQDEGIIAVTNPQTGVYRFSFTAEKTGDIRFIAGYMKKGYDAQGRIVPVKVRKNEKSNFQLILTPSGVTRIIPLN